MQRPLSYAQLRTGRLFLIILSAFCAAWITWNLIPGAPHFDDGGFARLTLILSVEASIATSVLMAQTEKQEAINREILKNIQDNTAAIREMLAREIERERALSG